MNNLYIYLQLQFFYTKKQYNTLPTVLNKKKMNLMINDINRSVSCT